jgi:hypothetical protein
MKQGRERDIEIAKLKGLSGQKHPIKVKKWSTSRNDAWELWDELPKPKYYRELSDLEIETGSTDFTCVITFDGKVFFQGTSFADCVSQVWIEYMENKNG